MKFTGNESSHKGDHLQRGGAYCEAVGAFLTTFLYYPLMAKFVEYRPIKCAI